MKIDPISIAEIAELAGLDRKKVASLKYWGKLPDPDKIIKACPLWDKDKIVTFLDQEGFKDRRKKEG